MNRCEGERAKILHSMVTERIVLKERREAARQVVLEGLVESWPPVDWICSQGWRRPEQGMEKR